MATETCPDVASGTTGCRSERCGRRRAEILHACAREVICWTMHADDQYVLEAVRLGVKGYVVKTQPSTDWSGRPRSAQA